MGQGTDKEGISGGAEASGLLTASILAIRTVSAFSMQDGIQKAYEKVSTLKLMGSKSGFCPLTGCTCMSAWIRRLSLRIRPAASVGGVRVWHSAALNSCCSALTVGTPIILMLASWVWNGRVIERAMRCVLCPGLLFWYGGKLVARHKYDFQEMMVAIMAILMGAMGLGEALTDIGDMKEAQAGTDRV